MEGFPAASRDLLAAGGSLIAAGGSLVAAGGSLLSVDDGFSMKTVNNREKIQYFQ